MTWFSSTVWLERSARYLDEKNTAWPKEKRERWLKAKREMTSENCDYPEIKAYLEQMEQGKPVRTCPQWLIRSTDGGKSWSEPKMVPLMAPHGPVLTKDGRLLWAGKREASPGDEPFIAVAESFDDGLNWEIIGRIPNRPGHKAGAYHELHLVDGPDGALIAQIRNHNSEYNRETLQTESQDGGKTWSTPHSIGVWGHPSHLMRLEDGRLLMTYGYRGGQRQPKEDNQILIRLSEDGGKEWSDPTVLAGGFPNIDFGYPSTVGLGDGRF